MTVCADCMSDLASNQPIGTTLRARRPRMTRAQRREHVYNTMRNMTITINTPHGKNTTTPAGLLGGIKVKVDPGMPDGTVALHGSSGSVVGVNVGVDDNSGDDNSGLSPVVDDNRSGPNENDSGPSRPASGWQFTRPTRRAQEDAAGMEDLVSRAVLACAQADNAMKELALFRAVDPRIIGVMCSRETQHLTGIEKFHATVTVEDPTGIDIPGLEKTVGEAMTRLTRNRAHVTVTVVNADKPTGDNLHDNRSVDLLDFPEFNRTAIGLARGVRVAPIRAVWDLLSAPSLPLISTDTLPSSVRNDRRVYDVWTGWGATIRRLRTNLLNGIPDLYHKPRYRLGRIVSLNHLTGHAAVQHEDVVIHWPLHVLMTISEDEPIPPDLDTGDNPAEHKPDFDPDNFKLRRKGRR